MPPESQEAPAALAGTAQTDSLQAGSPQALDAPHETPEPRALQSERSPVLAAPRESPRPRSQRSDLPPEPELLAPGSSQSEAAPKPATYTDVWLDVESLDIDANGIAHNAEGKVVFIEGALPGERVTANVHRKKSQWEKGTLTKIGRESSQRVVPGCPNFGLHRGACGGCKMQHLHPAAQVAVKQRVL
ncbi:MAG: TRAM domain-containing protein, partial [Burkholderiales bacterium]